MRSRVVGTISVMALAAGLAGCAGLPTGRFDSLATSTRDIQTKTVQTDGDLVKLTRRFMIFSPAPGDYKPDTFAPVIEVAGQKHDFDFGPRLEPREAALEVLAAYAAALAAFARKDYQGELDKATQDLGGSVQRLSSHALTSSQAKAGAGVLATAVNGLGSALIGEDPCAIGRARKARGIIPRTPRKPRILNLKTCGE